MKLPVNYDNLSSKERRLVREEYIKIQKNKCWYCNRSLDEESSVKDKPITKYLFPKNFFKHPVHLHHDHKTGLTEGAIHAHCNAVLWEYYGI